MQAQIDRGLRCCPSCESFGWQNFCGDCGTRYFGHERDWFRCPACKREVSTDWCSACGEPIANDFTRKAASGEIDIAAEEAAAAVIMERFYATYPEIAPEPPVQPAASMSRIGRAVLEVFGERHE